MVVIVCGGRNYKDYCRVKKVLDVVNRTYKNLRIVHGGAPGADSLADRWAKECNIPVKTYKADWKKYGKAAGPIRNKQMLDEEKPDYVIAFPGGKGTQNMVEQALNAQIFVMQIFNTNEQYTAKIKKNFSK